MIVRRSDFHRVLALLSAPGSRSLDTETTGLRPYQGDRLFSIIIGDENREYYFNFQEYPGLAEDWILPREYLASFWPVLTHPDSEWYLSNAKFDMAMLAQEGLEIRGPIHCTEALGRVQSNNEMKYGLDAAAKRIGLEKSNAVEEYITKHGLWEWEVIPGKKKRVKKKFFNKVPFDVMVAYACQDARVTRFVALHQKDFFNETDLSTPQGLPKITQVVENEKRFTQTAFRIEQNGIRIDIPYCESAAKYEEARYKQAEHSFKELTGVEFRDSESTLEPIFKAAGEKIHLTEKGAPSFTDKILKSYTSPVAQVVRGYRDAHKKCNTYYRNFLYYAAPDGRIHANIKQSGTKSGRVSVTDPALQTLPDEEEELELSFEIRKAFIPSSGNLLVMLDFDQMEYRQMLDYAGQMDLIALVLGGLDVHAATAVLINKVLGLSLTRGQAKTLNFGLLYGLGKDALAAALGCTVQQAAQLKKAYFEALPEVRSLIWRVTKRIENTGYIFNWYGRRSLFPDPRFAYKGINYLMQGGCGDLVKIAMNQIDNVLQGYETKMVMQVHDELVFDMPPKELFLVPLIKTIMESAYPSRFLPLTCSIEHSTTSWGEKVKGLPLAA